MPQPVDVYTWRNSIMSANGPQSSLARLVLFAVSLHMKSDGTGAWPAQKLLAKRAHMGERSVRRHLETAERHGWIDRTRVRRPGKAWYRTEYAACVPDAVYESLPERPWESDPEWRRPATVAATHAVSEIDRPTKTERPATGAERPANDDKSDRPKLGRLTLPLNSSKNSSREGALARTAVVLQTIERNEEVRQGRAETKSAETRKTPVTPATIAKLKAAGIEGASEIARHLKADVAEVEAVMRATA